MCWCTPIMNQRALSIETVLNKYLRTSRWQSSKHLHFVVYKGSVSIWIGLKYFVYLEAALFFYNRPYKLITRVVDRYRVVGDYKNTSI